MKYLYIILLLTFILINQLKAKETKVTVSDDFKITKVYHDNGLLRFVLHDIKYSKAKGTPNTNLHTITAYYKTSELAYAMVLYHEKPIWRIVFSKSGDEKCIETYEYYKKMTTSYEDLISDEKEGYKDFRYSKYLQDIVTFSNETFIFHKQSFTMKELFNFKKFIENNRLRKVVKCEYEGIKLNVTYKNSFLLENEIFSTGYIQTRFSKAKSIKNTYEAENLINKYFISDKSGIIEKMKAYWSE